LSVSIELKFDPAWDERGPGVGRQEKMISARVEKPMNMAASVLLIVFSAQTQNISVSGLSAEPTT
jgi:hypothetical protein